MTDATKVDPHSTLWVTDAELIRRAGWPEKTARRLIPELDKDRRSGFPRKVAMFGDRRYWPSVVKYFERLGGFPQGERKAS